MKKILFTLCLTFIMIFTFSVACMAAKSPNGTVLPTHDENTSGNGNGGRTTEPSTGKPNKTPYSPETGSYELGDSIIVTFAALGIAIVSMKKFSECK